MNPAMVIFDCDGVLVDSEPVANQVLANFLTNRGYIISVEDCIDRFVGCPLQDVIDEARGHGAVIEQEWREAFYALQNDALKSGVPLIKGVLALLDAVDRAGMKSVVVSNGRFEKMRQTLGPHGLWDRFSGRVYSPQQHGRPKPHPDMFFLAAKDAGVDPRACVAIDDSPSGVNGALAAGMRCIGYTEHTPTAKLEALGVETASTMDEVANHLKIAVMH